MTLAERARYTHTARHRVGRGNTPPAPHRSVREPLDSYGSCHPTKADDVLHSDRRVLPLPVDRNESIMNRMTRPLRSTGVTQLHRYYEAVCPWCEHRYFRSHGLSTCTFSLPSRAQVPTFRTGARIKVMPLVHRLPSEQ